MRCVLLLLTAFIASTNTEFKGVSVLTPVHVIFPLPTDDDPESGKNPFGLSIPKIRPVVDLALEQAYNIGYVPEDSIAVTFRDSKLSDAHGPNVAIQQLVANQLDCIIGYAFVYALAPVARMSPYWQDDDSHGIPVITPIGLTMNLDDKSEYQLLTRITSPYKIIAQAVASLFRDERLKWRRHVFMFNHIKDNKVPVGECFLLMASIQTKLKEIIEMEHNFYTFNERAGLNRSYYKNYLMQSSFLGSG